MLAGVVVSNIMESIKHKMSELCNAKAEAMDRAMNLEEAKDEFEEECLSYDTNIRHEERMLSKLEDELDETCTTAAQALDKLISAQKVASDAELEASALARKLQLVEEELERVNARYEEVHKKLQGCQMNVNEHDSGRKIADANSQQIEERLELAIIETGEAEMIATEAERKYEEVERKLRMMEDEHSRLSEKVDHDEMRCQQFEMETQEANERVRKCEAQHTTNMRQEDEYEKTITDSRFKFKEADDRAEFGERTVEKLETTIDNISEALFMEKSGYQKLSKKLDQTMREMLEIEGMSLVAEHGARKGSVGTENFSRKW